MYNVLVVGCGGSGVKTVAFMMDQLKADLRRYGVEEIPACWQFLAVDTPVQEEDLQQLGVGKISDQGGDYVSCGVPSGQGYKALDKALTVKLTASKGEGLRELATWMPRDPSDVTFPISSGAGQHRGIGRLLMFSHLGDVATAAKKALEKMRAPEARPLIEEVSKKVPGAGAPPDWDAPPLVLMVSSMAGGSGASMTLDVARVIGMTKGYDPKMITAFLYTADVFHDLPAHFRTGTSGNTLAMTGELISLQAGAEGGARETDGRLYSYFGLNEQDVGPSLKRAVPIGAQLGGEGGAAAGADSATIFRSVGRGLARYMSGPSFNDYVQYDLSNPIGANRAKFGWGTVVDTMAWSSFGYSSFSLGRERYLEYAAQRLARRAVNELLHGHRLSGAAGGSQQALRERSEQDEKTNLADLGLPYESRIIVDPRGTFDEAVADWVTNKVTTREESSKFARALVDSSLREMGKLSEGFSPAEWHQAVAASLARMRPMMEARMTQEASRLAFDWTGKAQDRLVAFTTHACGRLGAEYAHAALQQLSSDGGAFQKLAKGLHYLSHVRLSAPWEFPAGLAANLAAGKQKGTLSGEGLMEAQRTLVSELEEAVNNQLLLSLSEKMVATVEGYSNNAVKPMEKALSDGIRALRRDQHATSEVLGTAQVESEFYEQWPSDPLDDENAEESVPSRFGFANNEVVVMTRDQYLDRFDEHILSSVAAEREGNPQEDMNSVGQAYDWAVQDVVEGSWTKDAEGAAEEDKTNLIEVVHRWVPSGFSDLGRKSSPRPAQYRVRMRAKEVLDRARRFVGRDGEAFTDFAGESIHDYLTDQDVSEHDRQVRLDEVLEAMREAIFMAKPLSSIDDDIYHQLHGAPSEMHLKFSALPFLGIGEALDRIPKLLDDSGAFDAQTKSSVSPAGGDGARSNYTADPITRVDIFGSNAKTLPVAYTGILNQVKQDWDRQKSASGSRKEFWRWRRSRPLTAGIPFGDAERKALIKGWFIARLTGGLQLPVRGSDDTDFTPVRIWDEVEEEWVDFPTPLITAPSQFRNSSEYLPAVLESSLLALLEAPTKGLDAFRPYNVLRGYADASADEPSVATDVLTSGEEIIRDFLNDADVPPEGEPRVSDAVEDFDSRKEAALRWLTAVMQDQRAHYLPKKQGRGKKAPGWTNYSRRDTVKTTPMTVDLAAEIVQALEEIEQITTRTTEKEEEIVYDDISPIGDELY